MRVLLILTYIVAAGMLLVLVGGRCNKLLERGGMPAYLKLYRHREHVDVVSCLEVIEHVPDPGQLIKACSDLLKPDGQMFLSTLNRNPRSFITAILGAEYIFNILPKGTHEWAKFIKPSELEGFMRDAGIKLIESKGMFYNPIFHTANLNNDLGVNYMMHGSKNA